MKKISLPHFLFLLLLLYFLPSPTYADPPVFADKCEVTGWASYGGTVTGGGNAVPTLVSTFAQLEAAAEASGPRVIYIANVPGGIGSGSGTGGSRIDVASNKTIIGMPGAVVKIYFQISEESNIIIRNLIFQGPGAEDVEGRDNLCIQDESTRIWIDHCEFYDGQDGNIDIKRASDYVSITWCKFSYTRLTQNIGALNHSFATLIGSSDGATDDIGHLKVTLQYNWWEGAVERIPRVRYGQVHVVNNLYTEIPGYPQSKSGITAGINANVRVEKNAFYGIDDPIDTSKLKGDAVIQSIDNLFSSTTGSKTGLGKAFVPPYTIDMIEAADVDVIVRACAGASLPKPAPAIVCPCGKR